MTSVVTPILASQVPQRRVIARGLLSLLAVAIGLVVVAWWTRGSAGRPTVAVAVLPVAEQERQLSEAIERARASTVALEYGVGGPDGGRRVATGVVISDRGDVLSVRVDPPEGRNRESIFARDSAGHRHPARWVASDPETGLTLLKVEADDFRPIRPAARAAVLGGAVFLIGNPYGLAHSVSRGHIAGLGRRLEIGPRPLGGLIQIQAPLHPGDSGALLADMDGGWLGLVRSGLAAPQAKDDDDLGFAIPADDAMWVALQLQTFHKVDRAFLGVKLVPESPEPGAEVASVVADSPAEKAKLRTGDRIVRIDDQPIRTPDELTDRLDRTSAGAEVALEYARGPAVDRLTIATAGRPPRPPSPPPVEPPPAAPPTAALTAAPALSPPPSVPREVLDRIEHLERQVEELRKRETRTLP